jgi:hypothetical protein
MAASRAPREPLIGANGYPTTAWISYLQGLSDQLEEQERLLKEARETLAGIGTSYLKLSGGSLSGDLTISKNGPRMLLSRPNPATAAEVTGLTAGNRRFTVTLANATPEFGGNAGSNFTVDRHDDAGLFLDSPVSIERATGQVLIEGTHHAQRLTDIEARLTAAAIP